MNAANPPGQPDPDLTHDYMFNNSGGNLSVQFAGLAASQDYNLVLYVASDDAGGGDRSVVGTVTGSSTTSFSATGDPQSTFINGENVVLLTVTSDATGALGILEGDGPNNTSGEVDLAGLQLQSVPEPGSICLMGVGLAAIIAKRRK